ncbi:HD-GYP domain-containing protein [Paenibacillus abyssi]
MKVNKNIYNRLGVLVIPRSTLLTQKDIALLIQQDILIADGDVEKLSTLNLVDSAIQEIKYAFAKIRDTEQIPLDHIYKKVIPIIVEMSHHQQLKEILSHLENHDEYTYRHSIGVALIARLIGKAKGFNTFDLLELTISGFLHDIGKTQVPSELINKPGKLTSEEFELVKEHTVHGFQLLRNTSGISYRHAIVALQHHEREDGSGYPFGLKGEEIDPFSKIVAVADVFHAMISKRNYKDPVPFYKVLQEMSHNAYGTLEPDITLCFMSRIMEMLIGNTVILSNGVKGKIIMISPDDPVNPLIEVNGRYIDLSKDKSIGIERIL